MRWCVLLLLAGGCYPTGIVREQAAADFRCPVDKVQTELTDSYLVRARGCGRVALYDSMGRSPLPRASFDLQCPPEQLRTIELGGSTIGVEGCAQRASYALVDGNWVGGRVQ